MAALPALARAEDAWLDFPGGEGPGKGKKVVFLTGEELDRSEESAPMLARLLAERHGFQTTVLFSVGKDKGFTDPNRVDNIPHMEALDGADMMVMMLRFRELPKEDMERLRAFLKAGKPFLAVRSSTHAFAITKDRRGDFRAWDWQSAEWPGGFGGRFLGQSWAGRLGGSAGARGVIRPDAAEHPALRGVAEIRCASELYNTGTLPDGTRVLVDGAPAPGAGEPRPLVWQREYRLGEDGKPGTVTVSTAGSAEDLLDPGLRRLFLNAVFLGCGLEDRIIPDLNIEPAREYKPSPSGFNKFRKEVKPKDQG